jgi:hypothetical protein
MLRVERHDCGTGRKGSGMTDIDRDSLLEALASMEQCNFLEGSDTDVLTLLHSSEATHSGTPTETAATRSLQWLSEDDCWRLLKTAVVGRVGLQTSAAPVIHPVNFATVGRSVLMRTRADSVLAAAARRHEPVASRWTSSTWRAARGGAC